MVKHLVVRINSQAEREWEQLQIHSPIGVGSIDFREMIAAQLPGDGEYLVQVNVNVRLLAAESKSVAGKVGPEDDLPLELADIGIHGLF